MWTRSVIDSTRVPAGMSLAARSSATGDDDADRDRYIDRQVHREPAAPLAEGRHSRRPAVGGRRQPPIRERRRARHPAHQERWPASAIVSDDGGRAVRELDVLRRIKRLAIPPAWTDVWICRDERGHIQAVGRDAKGRRQYRYHERWREVRDEAKYGRMRAFGLALSRSGGRCGATSPCRACRGTKVLATIVRLLETTYVRIGNSEYMRKNGSFGLTTLRCRQAKVKGAEPARSSSAERAASCTRSTSPTAGWRASSGGARTCPATSSSSTSTSPASAAR